MAVTDEVHVLFHFNIVLLTQHDVLYQDTYKSLSHVFVLSYFNLFSVLPSSCFNIHFTLPIYAKVFQAVSFIQVSPS